MDPEEVSAAKTRLDNVLSAAERMEHFIQAIRKQLEHQDVLELFSLNAAIAEVVEILKYKTHKGGIEVKCETVSELAHYGNPLKFHQVVLNLVSNALDACLENKTSGSSQKHQVIVSLFKEKDFAILTVSDTGGGIPAEVGEKIFEPFFTTKDAHRGIGIGLSITKEIVERSFGGEITAQNVAGRGALFTVRFPLVSVPEITHHA